MKVKSSILPSGTDGKTCAEDASSSPSPAIHREMYRIQIQRYMKYRISPTTLTDMLHGMIRKHLSEHPNHEFKEIRKTGVEDNIASLSTDYYAWVDYEIILPNET